MDCGTWYNHEKVVGVQNKRREGEKMRDWLGFLLVKRAVLDCFELNNLTVIDLHVMRSAVHLINVVADFRKRDISQLFTVRQVNFTTKKVQK